MTALGTKAPDFSLPDVVTGKTVSLSSFSSKKALLVMFICRHCPYVQHIKGELAQLGRDYSKKDVGLIAISSNDAENYPDDSPEGLRKLAAELKLDFPIAYDESQDVAKRYRAACTPDFFLYDGSRRLIYRGQLDDSRPGNGKPLNGRDLREALDAVLSGKPVGSAQKPSIGCNFKWKSGNEPDYSR